MSVPLPQLDGRFEGVTNNQAQGWVYSAEAPRTRLEVELVSDGQVVARGIANQFRQSLLEQGIGDGKHGFSLPLPASLSDGAPHDLQVREAYSSQLLPRGSTADQGYIRAPQPAPTAYAGQSQAFGGPHPGLDALGQASGDQAQASGAPTGAAHRVLGRLDGLTDGRARGWLFSPDAPGTRLEVELLCGNRVLARGVADLFREDLARQGLGDGRHGFELPIDLRACDSQHQGLVAREAYSGTRLEGSPLPLTDPPRPAPTMRPPAPPRIEGHFDDIAQGRADGWVFSPDLPLERAQVEVVCDGRVVGRGTANRLREDLREAGVSDGRVAFSIPIDPALFDGQPHRLSVREASTGQTLDGSGQLLMQDQAQPVSAGGAPMAPTPTTPPPAAGASPPMPTSTPAPDQPDRAAQPPPIQASVQVQPAVAAAPAAAVSGPASAAPPPVPAAALRGRFEGIRHGCAEGWAMDSGDPTRRLSIEVHLGGQLVGRCEAGNFRPDLLEAGIGDGRHAFSLPLDASLLSRGDAALTVCESSSGLMLEGSPLQLAPDAAAEPPSSTSVPSPSSAASSVASAAAVQDELPPASAAVGLEQDQPLARASAAPVATPQPPPPEAAPMPAEPVESTPAPAGAAAGETELHGRFEGIINGQVCGWVLDPLQPERRIEVEICCDGAPLGRTRADLERDDLLDVTLGDGRHGFRYPLDSGLFDGARHELSVRALDSGQLLPGSPQRLETDAPPARVRPADVQGALEGVDQGRAIGYAWDVTRPEHRLEVEILCEGEVVARAIANGFRRDLYDSGLGDGRHGFKALLSYELSDGRPHWLSAREAHTGKALSQGPHLFEQARHSWPFDLMPRAETLKQLRALLSDPAFMARAPDEEQARRLLTEGCLRQEMRQTESARTIYRQLLGQLGENALCHCKLAETWLLDGEPDSALDAYREAASLPLPLHWASLGIGNALRLREQFVEAEDAYRGALRLCPRDPLTQHRLQEVRARALPLRVDRLVAEGKLEEGIGLLKAQLIDEPENALILDKLGRLLVRRDDEHRPGLSEQNDEVRAFDASLRVLELLLADEEAERASEAER